MLVYEGKDETRFMGRIKHEFAWCDVKMKIEDAFGYKILLLFLFFYLLLSFSILLLL